MSRTTRAQGLTERLDELDGRGAEHAQVLADLVWLNRSFRTPARVVRAVRSLGLEAPRIVDLGCGAGDVLAALRAAFPASELIGVDGNPATLALAAERVDARFVQADILAEDFVLPPCDVVVSTHFLYHLQDARIRTFVDAHPAPAFVLVELERSGVAAWLFRWVVGWFVSSWTLSDGLTALDRAFSRDELRSLLPEFRIEAGWVEMVAVRARQ